MNPEFNPTPEEAAEARLTALLLGELSAAEAAQVRQLLAENPEWAQLHARLQETLGLLQATVASEQEPPALPAQELKLSPERRQKLLTAFLIRPLKEAHKQSGKPRRVGLLELLAVLTILVVLTGVLLPWLSRTKYDPSKIASLLGREATLSGPDDIQPLATSDHISPDANGGYLRSAKPADAERRIQTSGQPSFEMVKSPDASGSRLGRTADLADSVKVPARSEVLAQELSAAGTIELPEAPTSMPLSSAVPESRVWSAGAQVRGFYDDLSAVSSVTNGVAYHFVPQGQGGGGVGEKGEALKTALRFDGAKQDAELAGEPASPGQPPVLGDLPSLGRLFRSERGRVPPSERLSVASPDIAANGQADKFGLLFEEKSQDPQAAPALSPEQAQVALNYGRAVTAAGGPVILSREGADNKSSVGQAGRDNFFRSTLSADGDLAKRGAASGDMVTDSSPTPALEAESVQRYRAQIDVASARREEAKRSLSDRQNKLGFVLAESASKEKQAKGGDAGALIAYQEQKQNLDRLLAMGRILGTKLNAEKVDQNIPRDMMPDIIDLAEPARKKSGVWPFTDSYASTARLSVDNDISNMADGSIRPSAHIDKNQIQAAEKAIQSEDVLGKALESLQRNKAGEVPQKDITVAELRKKLTIKDVPNTSLLEVTVRDDDAVKAAKLANAVAEAYGETIKSAARGQGEGEVRALERAYAEKLKEINEAEKALQELEQKLSPEADVPFERKPATNAPIPQPEVQTSENAFSTFSLNVSDVSFKLAAASLEKGQLPAPASIRVEEFLNAFDYRDPEPAPGVPVAFAWERARTPFAHNREVVRFSLKTAAAGRAGDRPLNLVLLLDNSGSMERADRVQILRSALRVLATQLKPQDKLSVITFSRTSRLWVDALPGDRAGEVAEQLGSVTPEGGTNLEEAMNLAYQTALRHYLAAGMNRVVLLTDGAANLGEVAPASLKQKVETYRRQGVALDCFGIGWEGYNDDLLEVLSRNGDGRYGFINSPEEAATEFAGQLAGALQIAASDVKVQVEFNPRRTTAYRQIGYAQHQLTKEQFRDNAVDAAEIAAQEGGNALYVVAVNPAGEGPLATVRVRYKLPGTGDYREQAWEVPYEGQAVALEQASPALRLATSASSFAEWLAASPYAGEVTLDRVLGYLRGVPEIYGADARAGKLAEMIRQAKSLEGK